ncbi:MAG: hypothetical protein JNL05_08145 [Flavobacteriales bacterium]|nr:hypothetical protein [Flavobacteriales bacterium]
MKRAGVTLLLTCLALWTVAQDPLHRRITMGEGLPSNTVYTILQDSTGFLWMGTDAGAVRYDGTHFDRFTVTDGLSDEEIFVVDTDRKGRVWFLTGNGRPSYHDGERIHSWRTDSTLKRVHVRTGIRSMQEDANGDMRFGGLGGEMVVMRRNGEVRTELLRSNGSEVVGGHITICTDAQGATLVFNNAALVRPGTPRMVDLPWSGGGLNLVRDHGGGRILCTTQGAVFAWKDMHWQAVVDSTIIPGDPTFIQAFLLADDELWITLRSGGVLWLKRTGTHWRPVREVLFPSDLINNLMRGREGNLWLCTDHGGVIMVTARAIRTAHFRGVRGGGEEFMRAHRDANGTIWCGTNQGDVYRMRDRLELLDLPPGGEVFVRVMDMESRADTLWVATGQDLFRLDSVDGDVRIRSIPVEHEYWKGARRSGMKALALAPDGQLVGMMYGAYGIQAGGDRMLGMSLSGIPRVRIYAPHFDEQGTLWFEEQGRLFSRREGGVQAHPEVDLPGGVRITDITSHGDTLFVATSGHGVLVLHNGRVLARITTAQGLSSDHNYHLFIDRNELFLAGEKGADKVSPPWQAPLVTRYATSVGGRPLHVRDVVADAQHAWVLFADGLCRMPRNEEPRPGLVPQPYIRTVLVNDSVMANRTIVGLRKGRDRLVVELGAVHLTTPLLLRLEYRLDPAGAWQRAIGTTLELSTLPAGDHVLQVRAGLEDGAWSEPVALTVVMMPPLWERWWAITLLLLLAMGLVFLVLRSFATRRLRRHEERQYERELVAHERQRIAMDLHDDLGAELSSMLLLTRLQRQHPVANGLERLEQLAGTLTEKMKEVIWSTDPGHDSLEATISFIQKHAAGMCARHGLMMRTQLPPKLPAKELSARVRRELFLLAKEALNNTLKHSGATTVSLEARTVGGSIELVFADDGRGFDEATGGRGMRNMAERARSIGAGLQVDGRAKGVRITLTLPLGDNRPNG